MTQPPKDDFAEGQEDPAHSPELPESDFARGQRDVPGPDPEQHGRFDEGQADFPEIPSGRSSAASARARRSARSPSKDPEHGLDEPLGVV